MLRSILGSLINPSSLFILMCSVSVLLFLIKKYRDALRSFLVAMIFFVLVSTPFIPDLLVSHLENQYDPLIYSELDTSSHYNILVLGAGFSYDKDLSAKNQLNLNTLGRLTEGILIFSQLPNSTLVVSGPKSCTTVSQAEVACRAAVSLGVKPGNIITLDETFHTLSEAIAYRNLNRGRDKLILVTNATHMPRAMFLFQRSGLHPIPAPTNFIRKGDKGKSLLSYLPDLRNINIMDRTVHEYAGFLVGWWETHKRNPNQMKDNMDVYAN